MDKHWRLITPGAAFLCAIALVISGFALYGRFREGNDARERNQNAWRLVLCLAESEVKASRDATPAQKQRAIDFYEKARMLVGAKPCDVH